MRLDRDEMGTAHAEFVIEYGKKADEPRRCLCGALWPCDVPALLSALDIAREALGGLVEASELWCGGPTDEDRMLPRRVARALDPAREALAILKGESDFGPSMQTKKDET